MSRAELEVDTDAIHASVHTLDKRVAHLSGVIGRLENLGSPPLGTFPQARDAIAWHDALKSEALDRLAALRSALAALRDGNATIAQRYEEVEAATRHDIHRHSTRQQPA
jgi:hypothetical protein